MFSVLTWCMFQICKEGVILSGTQFSLIWWACQVFGQISKEGTPCFMEDHVVHIGSNKEGTTLSVTLLGEHFK